MAGWVNLGYAMREFGDTSQGQTTQCVWNSHPEDDQRERERGTKKGCSGVGASPADRSQLFSSVGHRQVRLHDKRGRGSGPRTQ
jgi:hypothetical protein